MAEESMTCQTIQIEFNLDVTQSEVQPLRTMNPKLFEAAISGDKRILDELLQQEDFFLRDSMSDITIVMLEDVAIQQHTSCLLEVTSEGNTALHIIASRGYLELANEICCRERSLLVAPNKRLDTPLHCAARAGYDKMVSLILQFMKADRIESRKVLIARNRDGANALHEAAKYDHEHVVKILMEEDVGLASMLNAAGMSPLYLAIVTGSFDAAKALLQSSSWENNSLASYVGPNDKMALHAAVLHREITEEILKRKPMLAKHVDSSGKIPLHYAAIDGHHNIVKLLLECDPSTAYLSDVNGSFPIHMAASMGNFLIVDQILQQCFQAYELLDKEGKNFLHVAFQRRRLNVVEKILFKRPDLRKLLNDQDYKGNTPLHTAVENSDQRSVHFLLRDKTVRFNIVNHDGLTPLDLAYAKLDEGLHFRMNAEYCIASCLALIKAHSGPRELHDLKRVESSSNAAKDKPSDDDDKAKEKSSNKEAKEISEQVDLSRNLGIASVLIATVTFAAGFTVPGGYIADDHPGRGTAVLATKYAFKVFLISDAISLVCSIVATCWLMYAGTTTVDRYTRTRVLSWAVSCLWVAFAGMSSAFAMAIYVVLAPRYLSIGILLCFIALGTPLAAHMVAHYNLFSLVRTVGIRRGYGQFIWASIHPHVRKRLGPKLLTGGNLIRSLLRILIGYAIFFLLAMI